MSSYDQDDVTGVTPLHPVNGGDFSNSNARVLIWPAARGHGATVAGENAMTSVTRFAYLADAAGWESTYDAYEAQQTGQAALAAWRWMQHVIADLLKR
jgi:hypothetical protein